VPGKKSISQAAASATAAARSERAVSQITAATIRRSVTQPERVRQCRPGERHQEQDNDHFRLPPLRRRPSVLLASLKRPIS
jgi:hypothetical protein